MRICADVGGSFIDLAVIDDAGEIVCRDRQATPADDWPAFAATFAEAQARFAGLVAPGSALAIATAGLVAPDGAVATSANIACIEGRPLGADLGAALGRPIVVVNDADAFVLAEGWLGVARGHRRVFGIVLGTGVGGGLLEDGRLVPGPDGIAGEWGHGPIVRASPKAPGAVPLFQCGCGRWGCLDTLGGARGLERLHRFLHAADLPSTEIVARWQDGDPAADATIDYYTDLVSGPIAMILNTFPATIVPAGGGLANAASLIALLDAKIRAGLLRDTSGPMLVPATLGKDAGLLGAFVAASALRTGVPAGDATPALVRATESRGRQSA